MRSTDELMQRLEVLDPETAKKIPPIFGPGHIRDAIILLAVLEAADKQGLKPWLCRLSNGWVLKLAPLQEKAAKIDDNPTHAVLAAYVEALEMQETTP